MYDRILGRVVETGPTHVVLRAGGVGYLLEVPAGTAADLEPGREVELLTILHVVDGTPSLLGFGSRLERDLARRLLAVSGIGKAMTLAVLSTYSPAELARAVLDDDHRALSRVKGVGRKTAERLCLELRDHVAQLELGEAAAAAPTGELLPQSAEDAIAALLTLGFSEKEAREKVLRRHRAAPGATTEQLVKDVLRS